eukprot:75638-Chlamydomonas_euryale.AAC.1
MGGEVAPVGCNGRRGGTRGLQWEARWRRFREHGSVSGYTSMSTGEGRHPYPLHPAKRCPG